MPQCIAIHNLELQQYLPPVFTTSIYHPEWPVTDSQSTCGAVHILDAHMQHTLQPHSK